MSNPVSAGCDYPVYSTGFVDHGGGGQKVLHLFVILALLGAELGPLAAARAVQAASLNAPNQTEEPTATPESTAELTPTGTETATPVTTQTITPEFTDTYTPTLTDTPTLTPTLTDTPTDTPTFPPTFIPTFTPTPTPRQSPTGTARPPTPTPRASNTPTPFYSPTAPTPTATGTITPTATPTPTQETRLTLEVRMPNIKSGGMLHLAWQIESWEEGMGLTMSVPIGFDLQGNPGGEFDPATGTLTMTLTSNHGQVGWFIPDDLDGPYVVTTTLRADGIWLDSDTLVLVETGLTNIPAGGGRARGLNGRVHVNFPPGASDEDMKVYVRYPDEIPPDSPSGASFEILAIGQASRQEIHQFNQPLTIELEWGVDQPMATLYTFDEDTLAWLPLQTEIDRETGVLRATTNHLSIFDTNIEDWQKAQMPDISSFQVSQFTGAATYSYPIWVPPGPAGLQPSLSLSYNSQVVDASIAPMSQASWVGMGWSLNTGYIHRQMHGTMDEIGDDIFTLVVNGVSSTLLKDNTGKFHLADENFWKVDYNSGSDTWTVWDKEGNRYIFGNSADKRADYPAYDNNCSTPTSHETWKWALSEVRNQFNQALTYTYQKFQQTTEDPCNSDTHTTDMAIYPATISYPNSQYSVVFSLESRSDIRNEWDDLDARTFYENERLSAITIKRGTTVLRTYALDYDEYVYPGYTWDQGGRTFELSRIHVTGVGAHGDLPNDLPDVTFDYDGLHLREADNGYGGSILFSYETTPWYNLVTNDDYEYFYDSTCPSGWTGNISCPNPGTSKIGINGTGYHSFGSKAFQPGVAYKLSTQIINNSTNQSITVKLQYGPSEVNDTLTIGSRTDHCQGCTYNYESTVILRANANQLRWIITCSSCKVLGNEASALPTRYRVVSRSVQDALTSQNNVFRYEYDDPATNDAEHSAAVAEAISTGDPTYGTWYDEYRGNAMVREIGPTGTDGQKRVTATWFYQDDQRKGMVQGTLVGTQSITDTFTALNTGKWVYSSYNDKQKIDRIEGDSAIYNESRGSSDWPSFYRNSASLSNNEAILVSFRFWGSTTETVLAAENGTYPNADYRRWGLDVDQYGHPIVQYFIGGSQVSPYPKTLTGLTLNENTWYTLMMILDNDNLYLRLWERADPSNYVQEWLSNPYHPSEGQTWYFRNWVNNNGGVWLDAYAEMNIYQLSFDHTEITVDNSTLDSGYTQYTDLHISWTRPTIQSSWSYEGEGSVASGSAIYSFYAESSQGNVQYGNVTHSVESYWDSNSHDFVDYRITWRRFYPNTTNINLVGLPGYENIYNCPGGAENGSCYSSLDTSITNLLSSHIYLYDNSDQDTDFQDPPTAGILTNERSLLRLNGSTPYYNDVLYHYDSWGNQDTLTQYSGEGTSGAFASSGARTSTYCYGVYTGTSCSSDSYHTYLGWERNPISHYTRYQYDYDFGLPRWMQAPNDSITEADFDNFGRLYKLVKPGDTFTIPTLQVSYSYTSNSYSVAKSQLLTNGLPVNNTVQYYNGLGQLVQAQTLSAEIYAAPRDVLVNSTYDAYGNLWWQYVPYDVTPVSGYRSPETSRQKTTTTYDILGRKTSVQATDGSSPLEQYAYHVRQTVSTDAKGYAETTNYDPRGRVDTIVPAINPLVDYGYDNLDRMTSSTRGGAAVTLTYDNAGRKTSINDPDMGYWTYGYDALGNLNSQTDARGCVTTLSYDLLNRLTSKVYSGAACDSTPDVSYEYDDYSAFPDYTGATTYATGQRTGMIDASGKTMWTYDARGRMTREQKVVNNPGGGVFVTQWGYNSADLVTSTTYPADNAGGAGEMVTNTYFNQMALDTVGGSSTYVSRSIYNAAGQVEMRKLGGTGANPTLQTDYIYFSWTTDNGWHRLKQITTGTPADTNSLQDLRYYSGTDTSEYDANGNILHIYDYKAGGTQTQTFTYDSLNRLTSASAINGTGGTYSEDYDYNGTTGNLSTVEGRSYTYDTVKKHAVRRVSGSGGSNATVSIRAYSTACQDGVGATMELWVNDVKVQTWTNITSSWTTYNKTTPLSGNDKIDVVFTNDCSAGGYDRNLFIDYVIVGGSTIQAEGGAAIIDRGSGSAAFDGGDVLAGQQSLYWNAALRLVKGAGTYASGYDANGNMTSRVVDGAGWILTYDAENHLVQAQTSVNSANFDYDGDGKRVKSTSVTKNLASGNVVTGSTGIINPDVVTNGDTQADNSSGTSREFAYSSTTGLQYVQIDLGAAFPVNKVIVWHYNGDARTYHSTKTQVSADGASWTTVFDSATQGEYAETLAGKTHTFAEQNVRYVRDYLNGSTASTGDQWVEIEVWGRSDTVYIGNYFEWHGSAQTMVKYYHAGGTPVAVRHSNGSGTNGLVYLLPDHLGSTSITADPVDGDKLSELRFKAWGETRYSLTNAPTQRQYTGQISEMGSIGLYFYGARFYDPYLNRWIQPDTIIPQNQGVQAWDRYAFVNNNPVTQTKCTSMIIS